MKFKYLLGALLCSSLLFTACSDDDDSMNNNGSQHETTVPQNVQDAFHKLYKDVKDVKWETKGDFHVARFNGSITRSDDDYTSSAWFTKDGRHCQSDEEIQYDQLPAMVKEGFVFYKELNYPDWKIDDCELVLREGMGMIYVIEIEKGNKEREISLSEYGDILKDVADDDDDDHDIYPIVIPENVRLALQQLFPETFESIILLEVEFDDDEIELDVLDGRRHKEIKLTPQYGWISTEYEVTMEEALTMLDQKVANKLIGMAKLAGIDILDPTIQKAIEIEVKEHVTKGTTFEIEIELGELELELKIDQNGNITFDD